MLKGGHIGEQGCELEKVVGYKYNPSEDTLHVASSSIEEKSKRKKETFF